MSNHNCIQESLANESHVYKDLLQFAFVDHYHNISLKSIALIHWIPNNCLKSGYVVKADDDIVLNAQKLKHLIDNKTFRSGITGRLLTDTE